MPLVRALLILVSALLALATPTLAAADRVALVIGNSAYQNVSQLENPHNDATDLAAALERIGFTVTLALDLDFTAMRGAIADFGDSAQTADMALVYFAGHGIEIDKENFLIPVDAKLETDRAVKLETIPLDLITEAIAGATTLRMVLLDACRNNPFLVRMDVAEPGRSLSRGLAPTEPTGGTLVAFAAKGGTVAMDGDGRNSPFMRGLLEHIEEPGLDVSLLFRKVRDSVLAETANAQEPFTYGSLPGHEVYLVPPMTVAAGSAPGAETFPAGTETEAEETAWAALEKSTDRAALQQFILSFPRGVHATEAFERIVALAGSGASPAEPPSADLTVSPPAHEPPMQVHNEPPLTVSPSNPAPDLAFNGPCVEIYKAWKVQPGSKAFAANAALTACGYAHSWESLAGAETEALKNCTAHGVGACTIVAERER